MLEALLRLALGVLTTRPWAHDALVKFEVPLRPSAKHRARNGGRTEGGCQLQQVAQGATERGGQQRVPTLKLMVDDLFARLRF